ncbi:MAG: response regulator transcription factor [Gammaproteobacteria bacterium]|nr:response regulator transcription factor [Gammaproteobacteria bacterium]
MRIALLEDDRDQAVLLRQWLEEDEHRVHHYETLQDFQDAIARESFDAFLLDWLLPDGTGLDALKWLRQERKDDTPVIFVTQMDEEAQIVEALGEGADDYMIKPVRKAEMLARLKAVTRRLAGGDDHLVELGPYVIDAKHRSAKVDEEKVELTAREVDLASFLLRNPEKLLSRRHILENVWNLRNPDINTRTVDTHLSRLRRKLQLDGSNGWKLVGIYQYGYRLESQPE